RARPRSRGRLGAARAPARGRGQSARSGLAGRLIAMHTLHVLYGGTFDPVHAGHLAIARAAREALGVPVHLMPAADPPHRPPPGATAAQRVAMLELALEAEPGLCLDLRELARSGRSWSVDTLRGLRADIGDIAPVALLVGADSFAGLPTWKSWRELFALAHFVVASRDGNDGLPPALQEALQGRVARTAGELTHSPAGKVLWLRQPLHPHSATALRARIAAGEPSRHLVPAPVADYIQAHGLYRAMTGPRPGPGDNPVRRPPSPHALDHPSPGHQDPVAQSAPAHREAARGCPRCGRRTQGQGHRRDRRARQEQRHRLHDRRLRHLQPPRQVDRRRSRALRQEAGRAAARRRGRSRGRVGAGGPGRRRRPRHAAARARVLRARAPLDRGRPAPRERGRRVSGAVKARLIAVGEKAPAWVGSGFAEYRKRLSHWLPLELIEIEPGLRGKGRDAVRATADEG